MADKKNTPARKRRLPSAKLDIMDTTLRDGEQTQGVSMPGEEKLSLARRLLDRVKVDRIEVASCRVSSGELTSLTNIMKWAETKGYGDRVEVLSFVDEKASVDWMRKAGCRRMNLLTKGSRRHCEGQLRKTPKEHRDDIERTLAYAQKKGVTTSIYLEDWSNGMIGSRDYVYEMLDEYVKWPFERILLPDTLGVLGPDQVREMLTEILERYPLAEHPDVKFEFHGHNDYGLGTANALVAAQVGVDGIHCTVNGLGERAGNTPLEEAVASIRDHTKRRLRVNEKELNDVSRIVEVFSGKRVADNKAITGRNVFTQTAGIHADGDRKGNLYASALSPTRFGRDRVYALGKLSGRSNLDFNLDSLNMQLTKEQRAAVLQRVIELGDQKHNVTPEDLPFIVADVLKAPREESFEVVDTTITSAASMSATAGVRFRYRGEEIDAVGQGTGGFDAFMSALRSVQDRFGFTIPRLADYEVHIPPGGRSDALVQTTITWEGGIRTKAVHTDQVLAAVEATERMLNLVAQGLVQPENGRRKAKPDKKPKTGSGAKAKSKARAK